MTTRIKITICFLQPFCSTKFEKSTSKKRTNSNRAYRITIARVLTSYK